MNALAHPVHKQIPSLTRVNPSLREGAPSRILPTLNDGPTSPSCSNNHCSPEVLARAIEICLVGEVNGEGGNKKTIPQGGMV